MTLDKIDVAILDILRDDARLSHREVARRLDIPESRVRARLRKLQNDEVMRFSLIVQPSVAGFKVSAFVRFSVEAKSCRAAAEHLTQQDNVIYVSIMPGEYNILTVILAKSHSHLFQIINDDWRDQYNVQKSSVQIFFRSPKHRYDLIRLPD